MSIYCLNFLPLYSFLARGIYKGGGRGSFADQFLFLTECHWAPNKECWIALLFLCGFKVLKKIISYCFLPKIQTEAIQARQGICFHLFWDEQWCVFGLSGIKNLILWCTKCPQILLAPERLYISQHLPVSNPRLLRLLADPSISLCLMTAPNNLRYLLQVFSKWVKALETEKGCLKSTCLTGSVSFQVRDKWQLQWNRHKSCSLMRLRRAELHSWAFTEKVGTGPVTTVVSACVCWKIKKKSWAQAFLGSTSKNANMLAEKIRLVILILFTKPI